MEAACAKDRWWRMLRATHGAIAADDEPRAVVRGHCARRARRRGPVRRGDYRASLDRVRAFLLELTGQLPHVDVPTRATRPQRPLRRAGRAARPVPSGAVARTSSAHGTPDRRPDAGHPSALSDPRLW